MSKKRRTPSKRSARGRGSPWLWVGGIGLIVLLGVGGLYLSQGRSNNGLQQEVDLNRAKAMRDAGAFVLDVRTQPEWQAGHLSNSTWIPLEQLESRMSEVPRGRDILVVCASGNRSATARDMLLNSGYARVSSLRGGLEVWAAAGLPMVTGP